MLFFSLILKVFVKIIICLLNPSFHQKSWLGSHFWNSLWAKKSLPFIWRNKIFGIQPILYSWQNACKKRGSLTENSW